MASTDPLLGSVELWPMNWAPRGWALCEGQLLSIAQNTALFSLLGTTYGGDGRTTFGLPDMRGRVPVGQGHGPGLSDYRLGEKSGQETVTLSEAQLAAHDHDLGPGVTATLAASLANGSQAQPGPGRILAAHPGAYTGDALPNSSIDGVSVAGSTEDTGGDQAHENRQPYLVMSYIIALVGIYPSRN